MKQYNSISDLIREVLEYKFIDLIPHVLGMDESLLGALRPAQEGLYLPHQLEPMFRSDQTYILSVNEQHYDGIRVNDILLDIVAEKRLPPGNFYNHSGKLILRRQMYEKTKRYLKATPTVPTQGCEAAIAIVLKHLNKLCPLTHVHERHYELSNLIREGYEYLIEDNTFETALDDLTIDVMAFTRGSEWNIYHYNIVGTTLILEKGLDYRIYDWHIQQFKKADNYDEWIGDVVNETNEQRVSATKTGP